MEPVSFRRFVTRRFIRFGPPRHLETFGRKVTEVRLVAENVVLAGNEERPDFGEALMVIASESKPSDTDAAVQRWEPAYTRVASSDIP